MISAKKIQVGILGATGIIGQQLVMLLANHPWFEVAFLAASAQSQGKKYQEAIEGKWHFSEDPPLHIASLYVYSTEQIDQAKKSCRAIFSALPTDIAGKLEEKYANEGLPVISNAGFHRQTSDIPVLIPEINPHHLDIIPIQQKKRGWKEGFIAVKPNCSIQSYMIPLHPLHEKFRVRNFIVSTLQAISGGGYPGVSAMDIQDNVIPYISKEEEKSQLEPLKIWGRIEHNAIAPAKDIAISAHCNRVPVLNGHLACVSVQFEIKPSPEEMINLWESFEGLPQQLALPSAPSKPILYRKEKDRPQPRLDAMAGNGMSITIGRLRECPILDYRFTSLSHNTLRGAAGGAVLIAELLVKKEYIK